MISLSEVVLQLGGSAIGNERGQKGSPMWLALARYAQLGPQYVQTIGQTKIKWVLWLKRIDYRLPKIPPVSLCHRDSLYQANRSARKTRAMPENKKLT